MKVDIISGFLGAGKTSFINRYLPLLDEKIALIENEFGDTSIDSGLIEEDIPMKEIFAGCICCTLRGDFAIGIKEIYDAYHPERIVIEPSGVGRLSDVEKGIEDAGKMAGIELDIDRLIVMVDAETFEDFSENFGPFFLDQIENAQQIFLTNIENMGEDEIEKIESQIDELNPEAKIISSDFRDMDDEYLIKIINGEDPHDHSRSLPGDQVFSSFTIDTDGLSREEIEHALAELADRKYGYILRAKGYFEDGDKQLINYTPSKSKIEKAKIDGENTLVIIGTDLEEEKIREIFNKEVKKEEVVDKPVNKFGDMMTPLERLNAFMTGGEMDRLLIQPLIVSIAHRASTMTHREKRQSPELMAKALLDAYDRWGMDILITEYGLHGLGHALGTKMNDPEDSVPAIVEHVLQDLNDMDKLDFSLALKENDPWLRKNIEAVEILVEKVGDEVPIANLISGPFTAATSIYPMDKMLRSLRKDPENVHKLMRKTTDALKVIYKDLIEAGAIIAQCDPLASGTILHVKQYREFVKPYATEISNHIHECGGVNVYHICGDSSTITTDMVDTGCDILSIDNLVDLEQVKNEVGDRVPILGNIDPVGVLYHGPKEAIVDAVKKAILKAYDSPKGYILASGCDITQNVPLEHVDYFMEAGRKYGKLPIDVDLLKS